MLDSELIDRIRDIFLHLGPHVSISSAAALLGWSRREMTDALADGEITAIPAPGGPWICREELLAKALELWPLETIEEALGADADTALPPALRLADLRTRIPRYHLTMLIYLAARHGTSISDVLIRGLDDLASLYADELSAAVPGFAAAMAWPEGAGAIAPFVKAFAWRAAADSGMHREPWRDRPVSLSKVNGARERTPRPSA
jgi:hypothetical protein